MTAPYYEDDLVTLHHGDCLDVLRELPDASIDAVVTDPPYALEFMGKGWDKYTPLEFEEWVSKWAAECLRVLKPGGHILAFGGSRTWHRLAAGIEDAGFEIRDSIAWLYGSGFPKSLDVAKAITATQRHGGASSVKLRESLMGDAYVPSDRMGNRDGAGRRPTGAEDKTVELTDDAMPWEGWGTALKPSFEPIVVGRKPLAGTVAANVLAYGTGALNIDATRTAGAKVRTTRNTALGVMNDDGWTPTPGVYETPDAGRWPSNVVLDESQAAELDRQAPSTGAAAPVRGSEASKAATGATVYGERERVAGAFHGDSGGASRFFPKFRYEAKAPTSERPKDGDVQHPTVKPLDLMRWLVRLVTPPNGVVLEPFAGSGTTVEACLIEGFRCVAIEREADYLPLIMNRIRKPLQQSLFGDWEEEAV